MNRTQAAIAFARAAIGVPYVWGGESRREGGFDCSGLIWAAAKAAGVNIGRTTYQQWAQTRRVQLNQLRPGDLVFSDYEGTGKPTHVVLYIGNGKVIAAPKTGDHVRVEDLSAFQGHIVGAGRYRQLSGGSVHLPTAARRFAQVTDRQARRSGTGLTLPMLNPIHIAPITLGATAPQLSSMLGSLAPQPIAPSSAIPQVSSQLDPTANAARSLSALRRSLLGV